MSMGPVTGESNIDLGVGRYGLRTFKPAIVRGEPYLVSVAQDPIPVVDPRFPVKKQWRELLTDSHPISWADGTCTAVCTRRDTSVYAWGGNLVATRQLDEFHDAPPDKKCRCGIYALDDLKDLYNEYRNYTTAVVAVISASGRTIECEKGIRTQHARVVAYWVLDHQNCRCKLCATQRTQLVKGFGSGRGDTFPYVECCETQFTNADRWEQPDDMAVHYGLKATPLPVQVTTIGVRGRRAGKLGVNLAPIINHPPFTPGHYGFEIPWD